mmetsp:Transcript_3844/g.4775  ORF Transcript_3844/g.4775 Transcript_3844/m.4775 type:complete len:156 (-) Transcript_3844:120-587(-)
MQNVRPTSAVFAYFVDTLQSSEPRTGSVADQLKKCSVDFKKLPSSEQQRYYRQVLRDKFIFEQKEKLLKVIHKANDFSDKERLATAGKKTKPSPNVQYALSRVISRMDNQEYQQMEAIMHSSFELTDESNLRTLLNLSKHQIEPKSNEEIPTNAN